MMSLFQDLISFQREIYFAFARHIQSFADARDWASFVAYLPMGILFGAAHALTPGHSKTLLATYLTASPLSALRALAVSAALSVTHVGLSVVIALLSLPLISVTLGSVGRAPLLEGISRSLMGLIGAWMMFRALRGRPHKHDQGEGLAFGFFAGLIPCPLTLFIMTYSITRGVPEAGIAFAFAMMIGICVVLSLLALMTVLFRQGVAHLVENRSHLLERLSRAIEMLVGLILIAVAIREVSS